MFRLRDESLNIQTFCRQWAFMQHLAFLFVIPCTFNRLQNFRGYHLLKFSRHPMITCGLCVCVMFRLSRNVHVIMFFSPSPVLCQWNSHKIQCLMTQFYPCIKSTGNLWKWSSRYRIRERLKKKIGWFLILSLVIFLKDWHNEWNWIEL